MPREEGKSRKRVRKRRRSAPGNGEVKLGFFLLFVFFLSVNHPLFHDFNAVTAGQMVASSLPGPSFSGPGRSVRACVRLCVPQAEVQRADTVKKPGRPPLIGPGGPAPLLTFEYHGRSPLKGRCGPLACCILARRRHRGPPD